MCFRVNIETDVVEPVCFVTLSYLTDRNDAISVGLGGLLPHNLEVITVPHVGGVMPWSEKKSHFCIPC